MHTLTVRTQQRNQFVDVTDQIRRHVAQSGIATGSLLAFVPHTTAGITINENADPDVVHDILLALEELIPQRQPGFQHAEGNSDAHIKASLVGSSVTVIIEDGQPVLGTWQGIYFCEFDGPRSRRLLLAILPAPTA
ncbi:MAG: YjbQ family protein [Sedimentisphaerales bacterium]|nr:YjbQ family protein [Sedimentisphaerales bacterium]